MKKILLGVFFTVSFSLNVNAQNSFSEIIKSTPSDAAKLLNAYAEPVFKGFGIGLNSGWNSTAKTKGLFHFEVRVSATAAFVPQSGKTFDVTQIGLSNNIRPADATKTTTPTAAGSTSVGPSMNLYDNNGNKIESFNLPAGLSPVYGAPQIQATIGLPFNTDVTLRGMPQINFGDKVGSVSMIGGGIKHNLMEDFLGRGAKIVPFDMAVAFGYTHLVYNLPFNVQPYGGAKPKDSQQSTDFSNQHLSGHLNAINAQLILSKKIAVITPFILASYSSSVTNVMLQGNYPLTTGIDNIVTRNPVYTTFTDPITINERTINNIQGEVGFQLNLAFFRFYASYVAAQYQSVNGGIGFGF